MKNFLNVIITPIATCVTIIITLYFMEEYRLEKTTDAYIDHVAALIKKKVSAKYVKGKIVGDSAIVFDMLTGEIAPQEMGSDSLQGISDFCLESVNKEIPTLLDYNYLKINFLSIDSATSVTLGYKLDITPAKEPLIVERRTKYNADSVQRYCDSLTKGIRASCAVTVTGRRKWYDESKSRVCEIVTMDVILPYSMGDSAKRAAVRIGKDFCKSVLKDTAYFTFLEFRLRENTSIDQVKKSEIPNPTHFFGFPTRYFPES